MRKIWWFVLVGVAARGDFISEFEYGQMLYNNPRGISCAICHGGRGEGRSIVSYRDGNETRTIYGTDIRSASLETMEKVVARNHPVMPKYYLTHEEVSAIYRFIRLKNRPKKQSGEKDDSDDFLPTIDEFNTTAGSDIAVE